MPKPYTIFTFPDAQANWYNLRLYDQLLASQRIMVYEIRGPGRQAPITIVVDKFRTHLKFISDLINMDEVDSVLVAGIHKHLMGYPLDLLEFSIPIEEDDEPHYYRKAASKVLASLSSRDDDDDDDEAGGKA